MTPTGCRAFDDAQVIEMRQSDKSATYYAKLYGCVDTTIHRIRRGHTYKDVPFARPVSRAYERKFTDAQIIEIRASTDSNAECARRWNVNRRTIGRIRQGLYYKQGAQT